MAEAPTDPGVYVFFDDDGIPIYIGKASSLRHRLKTYARLERGPRPDDVRMVTVRLFSLSHSVAWQVCDSSQSALILESQLIRALRPRLNMRLGDDRGRWFVGFSDDACPRLFVLRAGDEPQSSDYPGASYVGPFPGGADLYTSLDALRRTMPFVTHRGSPARCLEFDLGLCPLDPARPESESAANCRRHAAALRGVLSGRNGKVLAQWRREMKQFAREDNYALAARRRDEIRALERLSAKSVAADDPSPSASQ